MEPRDRIAMTLACRDCDGLPKTSNAGAIVVDNGDQLQVMHNGVRVVAGGYHGDWTAEVISGLRGHHEPQEERIFAHLLRFVRNGSLMVELGSFWAYYTLWYLQEVPGSSALCVEPDPNHMLVGRRNAAANATGSRIRFVEAWVGKERRSFRSQVCESTGLHRTLPQLNMPGLLERISRDRIELLHIDAQGAELGFIQSMREADCRSSVRFLMVSTHHASISGSPSTHGDCLGLIRELGGIVLAEFSVAESFSGDGLIVASFLDEDCRIGLPSISRNCAAHSLFPELSAC